MGETSTAVSVNPNSLACWINCSSGTPKVTGMITAVAPAERARAMNGAQSVVSSGANVSPTYCRSFTPLTEPATSRLQG